MKHLKTPLTYPACVLERWVLGMAPVQSSAFSVDLAFPSTVTVSNLQSLNFLSSGERRRLKWTPPRLRADAESNVFCFLYLFRHTTLRRHPIKKFRKVVTGKTIPKSTVSANKASESLNARALSATQFTPSLFGRGKGFQTSPDLMRMDGSRDFGVSRCCTVSARTGVRGGSGWGGRRGGCTVSGTAAPSQGPTVHMRLN